MSIGSGMLASTNPLDHIVQHPLVTRQVDWGALTPHGVITLLSDHIVMLITAGVLLMLFIPKAVRKRRGTGPIDSLVPTGFANFFEAICQYLRKEVAEPALQHHTDRFIKYIWSVFFFVLTINLLGLVPIGVITPLVIDKHIWGTATANIWVTGTFAVTTLLMMVINGLRLGGVRYLAHFCPGPLLLAPLLVPVEIIGLVAKIFALAVRLFANMIAGHILLAVLLSFILSAGTSMGAGGGILVAIPVIIGSILI
ncbi:MAG: F0F1 ATP synthase subunit A, partial [Phycisphaerae bacterium]